MVIIDYEDERQGSEQLEFDQVDSSLQQQFMRDSIDFKNAT